MWQLFLFIFFKLNISLNLEGLNVKWLGVLLYKNKQQKFILLRSLNRFNAIPSVCIRAHMFVCVEKIAKKSNFRDDRKCFLYTFKGKKSSFWINQIKIQINFFSLLFNSSGQSSLLYNKSKFCEFDFYFFFTVSFLQIQKNAYGLFLLLANLKRNTFKASISQNFCTFYYFENSSHFL